jgi:hypothetical protein
MFRETTAQSPWPRSKLFLSQIFITNNHYYHLTESIFFPMANRVNKTPTIRPGYYAAQLAKALEDEAKAKSRSHHIDAARCESKSTESTTAEPESHNRSKFTHQSDRETELLDSSPDRLNESTTYANRRSVHETSLYIFLFLKSDQYCPDRRSR